MDFTQALDILCHEFSYARRTAYAHLAMGQGVFCTTYTYRDITHLVITGVKALLRKFQIPLTDSHFRDIPPGEFQIPYQRLAQIYASTHSPDAIKANPISRAAIQAYTGVTRTRQRRLEKASGTRRVPHYAVYRDDTGTHPVKCEVYGKSKTYLVNKQLPHSYRTKQLPSTRGKLRGIAISVRNRCSKGEDAKGLTKRYFSGVKGLIRALSARRSPKESHEGYYKAPPGQRIIYGRQEWVYVDTYV